MLEWCRRRALLSPPINTGPGRRLWSAWWDGYCSAGDRPHSAHWELEKLPGDQMPGPREGSRARCPRPSGTSWPTSTAQPGGHCTLLQSPYQKSLLRCERRATIDSHKTCSLALRNRGVVTPCLARSRQLTSCVAGVKAWNTSTCTTPPNVCPFREPSLVPRGQICPEGGRPGRQLSRGPMNQKSAAQAGR
jgi:hypothetical protein